MHDIRTIRADPEAFDVALARRGLPSRTASLVQADQNLRDVRTQLQAKQTQRREISEQIGRLRRLGAETAEQETVSHFLSDDIRDLERSELQRSQALRDALAALPNILDTAVPDGADETANVVLKQHGEPATFAFNPREHFELGEALGLMDFSTAAKISGARFTLLRGGLARLERALGQFMLDLHTTEHGYTETAVPLLVHEKAAFGTNQLPKFRDDLFVTEDGRFLIPTAEVPLTNTVAGDIIPDAKLPIRLAALSDCFRSEAGSAGRDTRGMLRQHQFKKVELVSITRAADSDAEHERMTRCAETVLERLGLPYRRMLLCAGDTGFGAARTHDLEVWLPGQGAWREISSCSNMRAFQARRMEARTRGADGKTIAHVHTLNGSGVAVGRALIAVMENYQQADGAVAVPAALLPYMGGMDRITS